MELLVQDDTNAGLVLDGILSLATDAVESLRIAVAYTTYGGAELLVSSIRQRVPAAAWEGLHKVLITSVDFGLTEPSALEYWGSQTNASVLLANAQLLQGGHLRPARAFHPKLYLFDQPGRQSLVVGSANLTRRALTVNTEIVSLSRDTPTPFTHAQWELLANRAVPLTAHLLQRYIDLRPGEPVVPPDDVPPPIQVPIGTLPVFPEEVEAGRLDPSTFRRFWVEAGSMSTGGSRNILELPRYANRFFGFAFADYREELVVIGAPVLDFRANRWIDRELAWHGAPQMNKMERLKLPTQAQGGVSYENTAVLFSRRENVFELLVSPWDSPLAAAWRNASARIARTYRLGIRGTRICGLL
ncbi:MAG: NgoFVII family restriction endonuclease [Phycisphaerales bacterium]|nr:NgoFVII family restriction endonuclease [Phycisphaerales bacterium]